MQSNIVGVTKEETGGSWESGKKQLGTPDLGPPSQGKSVIIGKSPWHAQLGLCPWPLALLRPGSYHLFHIFFKLKWNSHIIIHNFILNNSMSNSTFWMGGQLRLLSCPQIFSSPPNKNPYALSSCSLSSHACSHWQLPICILSQWIYLFWYFT